MGVYQRNDDGTMTEATPIKVGILHRLWARVHTPEWRTTRGWSTRFDASHTFPFVENEDGDYLVGYGHQDKAEFANAANIFDQLCDPRSTIDPYTANDVDHEWMNTTDGDIFKFCPKGRRGAFPVTVVTR